VAESRRQRPHVVLLDIDMPGLDPFEAIQELQGVCPEVRVIILSAFVRDHYIDLAWRAGAWGYLAKSDAPDEIIKGIRDVTRGDVAFSPSVRARTASRRAGAPAPTMRSRLEEVTPRELQILRLIAKGRSRNEIADELFLSPLTVDNHRKALMRKLGIHDRVELARFAIAEGLVEV
jgi:DNA-binding NarL/FixJ family response regulator